MPINHIVQQGDHLANITERYGFRDSSIIWDHAENSGIRQSRPNPNVLFPGDEVFIPDKEEKTVQRPTGQHHLFRVASPRLKLRLRLLDLMGKPLSNTPCELEVDGENSQLQTDDDGMVERDIRASATEGVLRADDMEFRLHIGHLDPVEEETGLHARLNNLGYYVDDIGRPDEELLQFALELFQWDNKLGVDGEAGPDSRQELKDTHGC
jgi:N-acetylmuramoyl-L-alanine amidase